MSATSAVAPAGSPPLLELSGISKRYGDLVANDDISLWVRAGEVVAMLGENGAGKSTLMKVVYGLVRPDAGAVSMAGAPLSIGSPRDAMAAGIGMVTQEFSLVETMTVEENIALSGMGPGPLRRADVRRRVTEAMERVGVRLEPARLVSTLSIGERQRVEIVKALFHDCRVVILDEPTAVLAPQDVDALLQTVRRLRGEGLGVLLISHKLREVADVSDRVVVLRRGRLVGERVTAEVSDAELAGLMMGTPGSPVGSGNVHAGTTGDPEVDRDLELAVGLPDASPAADPEASGGRADRTRVRPNIDTTADAAPPVLRVSGIRVLRDGHPVIEGLDLVVRAGEIVGVAGISGNGQTELVDVLSGLVPVDSGMIEVAGTDITVADVASRFRAGLGRITEDRRGSVVPQMSVEYNLVLEELDRFTRRGVLDRRAIRAHADELIERFGIRASPDDGVGTLSGGNVQKMLLARALARQPRMLVVSQPTRGLDIGAYRYVHQQLEDLRDAGVGVLLVSEDLDELTALSNRIVVLLRGALVAELPVEQATTTRLGVLMTGGVP